MDFHRGDADPVDTASGDDDHQALPAVSPTRVLPAAKRSLVPDPWFAAWMVVAFITFFLGFRDLALTDWSGDRSIDHIALWGRDFVNVYTSGSLVLQHKLAILYDVGAYQAFQTQLFESGLRFHNYSYPPVTLLYTPLLALLPYKLAVLTWLGGTGAFFAWAARPYLREVGLPLRLAILAPASLVNLWAGHYGFLIGGLWLAAWHILPRRPILAGVLIGLMVVKPHMALLAPFVLARRRAWPAIAAAAATAGGLVLASILIFGWEPWRIYLTQTAMLQASMVDDVDSFFIRMMPTLTPSLALLGVATKAAFAAQIAAALGAAALLLWKLPARSEDAGLATATATFLALPYAFAYDMTVVGLASMILFRRAPAGEPLYTGLAAATFLAPVTLLFFNPHWPVAPILLFFQLLVLLGLMRAPEPRPA